LKKKGPKVRSDVCE